ncbi:MAG: replication protein [Gemmataceae bacterium]|nr:replication protein [Gemmataceae bacterium]
MPRALIPNSTQVPDVILDHWMAELSGAEFKVLLYIARRTYGFGKDKDAISLSQIAGGLKRRDGTVLDRGTGASRSSVARSLKALEERGLIVRTSNLSEDGREFEENTYRINLDWEPPSGGPGGPGPADGEPDAGGSASGRTGGVGVVSKSDHPRSKSDQGWSHGETTGGLETTGGWSQNETHKKQIQETAQETASAGAAGGRGANAADARLVGELVAHGVGRAVAEELARGKPDVCRRCLDYLPFAHVKTTRGAWLANAIRGEYGPPAGFVKARALGSTVKRPETPHRAAIAERARAAYARLEQTRPEAITAFTGHVAAERQRAERIAARLSPRRREEYLADFDSRDRQLELFARWLAGDGAVFAQSPRGRGASGEYAAAHAG